MSFSEHNVEIIRKNFSQMLHLPYLSHMQNALLSHFRPSGKYLHYLCSKVLCLIQYINVNHCPLKWDGLFCLHPTFLHYGICGRRAFIPHFIVHGGINPVTSFWRWGCSTALSLLQYAGGGAAAPHARLLCCDILFYGSYNMTQETW